MGCEAGVVEHDVLSFIQTFRENNTEIASNGTTQGALAGHLVAVVRVCRHYFADVRPSILLFSADFTGPSGQFLLFRVHPLR